MKQREMTPHRIYHRQKAKEAYERKKAVCEAHCKNSVKVTHFLNSKCFFALGASVPFKQFCVEFSVWAGPAEAKFWNPTRIEKALGNRVGLLHDRKVVINTSFIKLLDQDKPYIIVNGHAKQTTVDEYDEWFIETHN